MESRKKEYDSRMDYELTTTIESKRSVAQSVPQGALATSAIVSLWLIAATQGIYAQDTDGQATGRSARLPRVEAGTMVESPDAKRWNRVVLLARPRIASGDVNSLPKSIKNIVSSFVLSILATSEAYVDAESGAQRYRLAEVGVGYAMDIGGELKIVTVADAAKVGARLGFIQRQMLTENQKQLDTARLVARTSTITVFDTPALLWRQGEHRDYIMRHFIWIDSRTGKNSALAWLMQTNVQGELEVADEPMRWIPAGLKEDRAIHVDGDEFLLGGIPTEKAFALEDLPPGKDVAWTAEAREYAAHSRFDLETLKSLTFALNSALKSLKSSAE